MQFSRALLSSLPKFVTNRKRVLYANSWEAARDIGKVSIANILAHAALFGFVLELGFPTPDVVYNLKMLISPDFALFAKYGRLAEYDNKLSNEIRFFAAEEEYTRKLRHNFKTDAERFGSD